MVLDIQTVHHILKNTAFQNVNKPFVYITALTSPLKVSTFSTVLSNISKLCQGTLPISSNYPDNIV
jgi:hypothetical protein